MRRTKPWMAGLIASALAALALPAVAENPPPPIPNEAKTHGTITVRIEALRNNNGTVYVSLFDNKKAFGDNKGAVVSVQARPANRTAVVMLDNVAPGRYALSFIHDENDNKKLDTNWIGIPKEGFGYSKDAMGKFGPPKFDDALLDVPAGPVTVVMHTKYM
ncbi:MAG TPA: DUF2141 domain-containing protein [Polyangia bacterium]